MSEVYSLTYVSCAVTPFSSRGLRELLSVSRAKNARAGITGLLLYKEGNFMQVLEGPESAVCDLYATIARDTRHRDLIVLLTDHAHHRQFSEWSMGFDDLGATSTKPQGYSDFLDSPLTGQEFAHSPERAQKLLLLFKARM